MARLKTCQTHKGAGVPARGQKESKREKEEESESGGVIGREVGANWRVVCCSAMFLFIKTKI